MCKVYTKRPHPRIAVASKHHSAITHRAARHGWVICYNSAVISKNFKLSEEIYKSGGKEHQSSSGINHVPSQDRCSQQPLDTTERSYRPPSSLADHCFPQYNLQHLKPTSSVRIQHAHPEAGGAFMHVIFIIIFFCTCIESCAGVRI